MSNIWFTADTHFGHRNIAKHCGRPFERIEDHDDTIVAKWNERVHRGDRVYHLGDFGMPQKFEDPRGYLRSIIGRLNGQIYLLRGNHDKLIDGDLAKLFVWVKDYFGLKVKDADARDGRQYIVLCHYAFRTWNQAAHGAWNLHGHSHGNLADWPTYLQMDVGVDNHDFAPISYPQVKQAMATKRFESVDHHGERHA